MSNLKELRTVHSRLTKDRKRAESEVKKIDSTLQKIEAAIAELQGGGRKEKDSSPKNSKQGSRAVGRRTWTEEQKREAGERMKKIWAKKRRAKKARVAKGADESSEVQEHGEGSSESVRAVPQAVA